MARRIAVRAGTEAPTVPTTIPSNDGTSLSARAWPGRDPRGTLVIAHGVGEHSGCYDALARELADRPGLVDVIGFDFRGHGRTVGARGVVGRYDDLIHDLAAVLRRAAAEHPGRPLFVLGHSNGGQVALWAALRGDPPIDGLILSNPFLALHGRPPGWKLAIGRLLEKAAPWATLSTGLDETGMTRDAGSYAERRADPLRHNRISAPLYFGMTEGGARLIARAAEIRTPVLLVLGERDPVADPAATRTLYERLGSADRTLLPLPEALHEPLNDLDAPRVRAEMFAWLEARLDRLRPATPAVQAAG